MGKRVAEIIVEVLEQAGINRCCGSAGNTLNLFAENLEHSSIDWVSIRHEEAGAFAAGTEALHLFRNAGCGNPAFVDGGQPTFDTGIFAASRV